MQDQLRRDRDAVINAMLPNVPFDGWSMACARTAAKEVGIDGDEVAVLFPGGPIDMAAHYSDLADRQMLIALAERDLPGMRIRDRIATGIRVRLDLQVDHREAVRRAVAITAMPQHAALSTRLVYRTVDAIWRVAGDTATDFNFYSKRALLAWVYGTTLLHWLDDDSEDHHESWAFMERRIDNVMQIPKLRGRFKKALGLFPNPLRAAQSFKRGASALHGRH